jgi:hypothetical protein
MSLAVRVLTVCFLAGALLAPRRRWRCWAFIGFVALGLFSFALRAGWPATPLSPRACELVVAPTLALYSFRNSPHIVLFAACFLVARAAFRDDGTDGHARRRADVGAFATTMIVGALVELAEGLSGSGHCRLRDLLPDATGALLGWALLAGLAAAYARRRAAATVR